MILRIKLPKGKLIWLPMLMCFLLINQAIGQKVTTPKALLAAPSLIATPTVLTGFTTEQGQPSAPQAYTLIGSELTDSIRVTASFGVEISPNGTYYSNSLTLPPDTKFAIIIVRLTGAFTGAIAGSITNISTGSVGRTVAISGTVTRATGITPISAARQLPENSFAVVQGIVTVNKQFDNAQLLYIQDKTGGIALFVPATSTSLYPLFQTRSIQVGNEIQVIGRRVYQRGVVGLTSISSLSVVSFALTPPTPKRITALQMADAENQGVYVQIDSSTVTGTRSAFVAETDFTFADASQGQSYLRIRNGVNDLVNSLRPSGKTNLRGIIDGLDTDDDVDNGLVGVRLFPRSQADIPGTTELVQQDGGVTERNQTLDVATWNLDSLGAPLSGPLLSGINDVNQITNATGILRYLNADLVVLPGVSNPLTLSSITTTLNTITSQTYVSVCPVGAYYAGTNPRVCFLYKSSLFATPPSFTILSEGFQAANWDAGRYPVLLTGDVTLNGLSRRISFVGIHAHEGTTIDDYMIRQRASTQLKSYLDNRPDESFIVLGDFNDDVDASIATPNFSPYANFVSAATSYSALTRTLSDARLTTTLDRDNVTDHILISNELFANYLPGTVNTLSPDAPGTTVLTDPTDWGLGTSDHLPVFARFSLATPGSLTATLAGSTTLCGSLTANVNVSVTGGVAPYRVVISDGSTTRTITNYVSGASIPISVSSNSTSISLVSVTDALSITAGTMSGTALITVLPNARPVSVTITPTSTSFCQGRTVPLSATVGSGQLPLTYRWNTGAATPGISATATGTYSLTVVDALGCSAIASTSTTVNTIPDLSSFGASSTALCTGTAASPITTFTANLGTLPSPYSYTLGTSTGFVTGQISTTGTFSQAASITGPAVYTLRVATPQGCTATTTQSISLNTTPTLAGFSASPSCAGRPSTFTAAIGGLGFTATYNYTITNGVTDAFGTGFGTGPASTPLNVVLVPTGPPTYSLIVANRNCLATSTTNALVGTTAPVATLLASNTLISCIQPSATLFASGGVSFAFSPINGGTLTNNTGTVTVTSTGIYNVVVTDAFGCTATATTIILANVERPTASLIASNQTISCTNPTSTLLANGGANYQFSGPNGVFAVNSTGTTTVSQAGTYNVIVTTAGGCTATATTTIQSNNTSSTVQLSANGVLSCGGTSVRLSAIHTGTAQSYRFSRPDGSVSLTTPPFNYIDVTVGGPYQVDVIFSSGCTSSAFLTLTSSNQAQAVTLSPNGQLSCSQSTVRLTAVHNDNATGYRFTYPNGTTILTSPPTNYIDVTSSGTYQVAVTFPGGCSSVAFTTLTPNSQVPTVALNTSGPLACSQATVRLSAIHTGDAISYRFTRPDGSVLLTNAPTNYIDISAGGGYSVAVTFPGGCSTVASTFISTVGGPNVALTADGQIACDKATVTLTATHNENALQYELGYPDGSFRLFGSNRFNVTAAGTYTVKVTFISGCISSASTSVVRDPSAPSVSLSPNGNLSCAVTTVRLTANTSEAAASYRFTGPSGTSTTTNSYLDVSSGGSYSVVATFTNSCTSLATATVQSTNEVPAVDFTSTGQIGCGTSSVTLTAQHAGTGYSYQFFGPGLTGTLQASNRRVVTSPGTYTVVVGFLTCSSTASAVITVTSAVPTVTLTSNGQLSCQQNTVRLTANASQDASSYLFTGTGGFSKQTSPPTNYIDVTTGGTYNVVVSFPNGCTSAASVTLSSPDSAPTVLLAATSQISCSQPTARLRAFTDDVTSLRLLGPNGLNIQVNPTPPTTFIDVSAIGLYTLVATFPSGCTSSANATVASSGATAPTVTLTPDGTLSCGKTSVRLTATHSDNASGYQFTGPNGFATSTTNNFVDVSTAGSYQVAVTFPSGCSSIASANVTSDGGGVSASISGNLAICAGNGTTLTANGGSTYRWSTGAVTQSINVSPTITTTYSVTVSQGGCSAVQSANVVVSTCTPVSALSLLAPTYNCETGQFTFRSAGGDGTAVEYFSIGITGWTTNAGPYTVKPAADADSFSLQARNSGNPGAVVTYIWDWKAACPKSSTIPSDPAPTPPVTTTPPATTTTTGTETGCSSPANTIGQPLQLIAPTFNCQTGAITFKTTGGNGEAIEFMSIGITGWTTNCQSAIDNNDLLSEIRNQSPNVQPFTLLARQSGTTVSFSWDAKAACISGGRPAIEEPAGELAVTVLGNPTLGEQVEIEIRGAEGRLVAIRLTDSRGEVIYVQKIQNASTVERQTLKLGRMAGMYLLQVNTPNQAKTVKILRQ